MDLAEPLGLTRSWLGAVYMRPVGCYLLWVVIQHPAVPADPVSFHGPGWVRPVREVSLSPLVAAFLTWEHVGMVWATVPLMAGWHSRPWTMLELPLNRLWRVIPEMGHPITLRFGIQISGLSAVRRRSMAAPYRFTRSISVTLVVQMVGNSQRYRWLITWSS